MPLIRNEIKYLPMVEMSRFRKSHKNRKQGGSRRRQRRQGGAASGAAVGAPLSYQLQDQALAQGRDYLSYHEGQHGGANPLALTPLEAIDGSALAGQLRGPAMLGGIDRAFADIAGLRDQQGGKRRSKRSKRSKKGGKRSKRSKKGGKRSKRSKKGGKRSKRHNRRSRRHRRSQGGSLGFAPFPSQGMLLSPGQSARAGLSQGWADAVEFDAAQMRAAQ
jgi:hypothetical protein